VIVNIGGEDSKPAIINACPNVIAVGDDWACKDYHSQMQFTQEWLDEMSITLVYIAFRRVQSSTNIKTKI